MTTGITVRCFESTTPRYSRLAVVDVDDDRPQFRVDPTAADILAFLEANRYEKLSVLKVLNPAQYAVEMAETDVRMAQRELKRHAEQLASTLTVKVTNQSD